MEWENREKSVDEIVAMYPQVTHTMLNLIMFYHNHRRYNYECKRHGKTPNEILSETKQEKCWIELISEHIKRENPAYFASL